MSAEILRRAAALMRERAEAATPGPWEQVTHPVFGMQGAIRTPDGDINMSAYTEPYRNSETAEHIASWHPAVALAVAAWLEADAKLISRHGLNEGLTRSYAVARTYLGEQP